MSISTKMLKIISASILVFIFVVIPLITALVLFVNACENQPNTATCESETKQLESKTQSVECYIMPIAEIPEPIPVEEAVDNAEPGDSYVTFYSEQDVVDLAKLLWRECRGVESLTEQACVAWTVLNRVDLYGATIYDVLRAPNQFAFHEDTTVHNDMLALAKDTLERWSAEKNGEENCGRVLPQEYIYFYGKGGHNYFRDAYRYPYHVWDYSLESPYDN